MSVSIWCPHFSWGAGWCPAVAPALGSRSRRRPINPGVHGRGRAGAPQPWQDATSAAVGLRVRWAGQRGAAAGGQGGASAAHGRATGPSSSSPSPSWGTGSAPGRSRGSTSCSLAWGRLAHDLPGTPAARLPGGARPRTWAAGSAACGSRSRAQASAAPGWPQPILINGWEGQKPRPWDVSLQHCLLRAGSGVRNRRCPLLPPPPTAVARPPPGTRALASPGRLPPAEPQSGQVGTARCHALWGHQGALPAKGAGFGFRRGRSPARPSPGAQQPAKSI